MSEGYNLRQHKCEIYWRRNWEDDHHMLTAYTKSIDIPMQLILSRMSDDDKLYAIEQSEYAINCFWDDAQLNRYHNMLWEL